MYLLRDLALEKNEKIRISEKSEQPFRDAIWRLERALERMVDVQKFEIPGKVELEQMYPNLLFDISRIAEGGEQKKASIDA
jgi:hypothetical protein